MSLTLAQIRAGILRATGTELSDWENGNTDLDLYANKSWWDIMDKFDFREKEAELFTFPTVASQREYDIVDLCDDESVTFDAIQRLSIEDPEDFTHKDLELISDFDYENEYVNSDDFEAKPTKYFRRGTKIFLYPTPDQAYDITVYTLAVLSDIPSNGPVIPQSWHEIIQAGANWRAFLDLGDDNKMSIWMGTQEKLISGRTPVKVKELSDTKMAHVEIPGRDYP